MGEPIDRATPFEPPANVFQVWRNPLLVVSGVAIAVAAFALGWFSTHAAAFSSAGAGIAGVGGGISVALFIATVILGRKSPPPQPDRLVMVVRDANPPPPADVASAADDDNDGAASVAGSEHEEWFDAESDYEDDDAVVAAGPAETPRQIAFPAFDASVEAATFHATFVDQVGKPAIALAKDFAAAFLELYEKAYPDESGEVAADSAAVIAGCDAFEGELFRHMQNPEYVMWFGLDSFLNFSPETTGAVNYVNAPKYREGRYTLEQWFALIEAEVAKPDAPFPKEALLRAISDWKALLNLSTQRVKLTDPAVRAELMRTFAELSADQQKQLNWMFYWAIGIRLNQSTLTMWEYLEWLLTSRDLTASGIRVAARWTAPEKWTRANCRGRYLDGIHKQLVTDNIKNTPLEGCATQLTAMQRPLELHIARLLKQGTPFHTAIMSIVNSNPFGTHAVELVAAIRGLITTYDPSA